jgi:hypothetical protein
VDAHEDCARLQEGPTQVSPSSSPSSFHSQRPTFLSMFSGPNRTSTPSDFEALFDAALEKYTKRTGQDLRNHELARMLDRCESPDSILAIFKEQSQAFDEFRNGDPKLIKWLKPIVKGLHTISTSAAISAGASLVSMTQYPIYPITNVLQLFPLGISPFKTDFCWNWYPPLRACHSCLSRCFVIISASARRPSTCGKVTIPLLMSSNASKTF